MDNSENTPETTLVVNTPEQAQWFKEQIECKPSQKNYKEAQKSNFYQTERKTPS